LRKEESKPLMEQWTYCKTSIPEYLDLLKLARVINYNKRRMMSIMAEPESNGYGDMFTAQEAINKYLDMILTLSTEYRYMVIMYVGGDRIA
jgi:hypothetical protein